MADPATLIALASAATVGVTIAAASALRGWSGWLELRRTELSYSHGGSNPPASRTKEIAELRERVRRLEAIASGTQ
ncbi:MAG: hypothetical protein AVDCRST_MAG91-2534 [uncultured Sphingomonadaceae bacterium]|uniref:Uncharacterized protein n=1 Tax=uncultured Sphingomonadaceae bacterium TaxID=169976 RepID=A0A6J4TL56_9SPHN|nr:MAG: hypothetical protein AVDCRST_MAG91-2534 [uncultured Sphingomonadaceae bacterium]